MKAKVIKRYQDKETKKVNNLGDVIDITQERYLRLKRFVALVPEAKKTSKK